MNECSEIEYKGENLDDQTGIFFIEEDLEVDCCG